MINLELVVDELNGFETQVPNDFEELNVVFCIHKSKITLYGTGG